MKRGRTHRRILAGALAAACAMALPRGALGQDGPIAIEQERKSSTLKLENWQAAVELQYRRESDDIKPKLGTDTKFDEDRFEEKLSLGTTGYIVHPNFVELNLSGTFGLVQDSTSSSGAGFGEEGSTTLNGTGFGSGEAANSTLYEWDASALILKKRDLPTTVYSRRTVETISQEFAPSLDSTVTQTGVFTEWRSKTVPTRVEIYRMDQDQKSLDGSENYKLGQDTATMHSDWHPSDRQSLSLDATINQIDETNIDQSTDSYNTQEFTVSHSYDFGPKEKYKLLSSLNYFNQGGNLAIERLRWDELLRADHTENFSTSLHYSLDQQSFDETTDGTSSATDQTQNRLEGIFTHKLYKSLITTGTVGVLKTDRNDGNSNEEYARLDFDYTKKVPLGTLLASMGFGYDTQDNQAQSGDTSVLDSQAAFSDPLPITLIGQNIKPSSIRITDATGRTVYLENRDYLLRSFADHVEIDRLVGGRISNQQPILIDYQLSPQAANTVDTPTFHAGARYRIEQGPLMGLAPYIRYFWQDQTISSDVPSQFTPSKISDIVLGTDYKRGDFTLTAEQEWNDSSIQPLNASRFIGQFNHALGRDTTITLNGNYSIIDFTDTGDHTTLLMGSIILNQRIGRDLRATATVIYRHDTDEQLGNTTGLEEQVELHWDHRQLHFYLQARNSNLNFTSGSLGGDGGQDTSFLLFQIGVRREF